MTTQSLRSSKAGLSRPYVCWKNCWPKTRLPSFGMTGLRFSLARVISDRAEHGFNRAIELDSRNADAITNLGLLLLGRGDSARAVPLLKQALPLLPIEQQKIVNALLADHPAEQSSASGETTSDRRTLRVLVIADSFPNPVAGGHDRHLLELLHGNRNEGDAVTFIAREAANRKQCEPWLHQAGIHTYADDLERLPCLGWKGKGTKQPGPSPRW